MDIAKENPVTMTDRAGVKGNLVAFSASKRLTALSDVRNTVHKKRVAEPSFAKRFLEVETGRSLETTSPRLKPTPTIKRSTENVNELLENLDDYVLTACRCNVNDDVCEEDFLPEGFGFGNTDIDNLRKIWFGQGGREEKQEYIFSPLKVDRSDLDLETLVEKINFDEDFSNDSGIDLDIELELGEMHRDFQVLL